MCECVSVLWCMCACVYVCISLSLSRNLSLFLYCVYVHGAIQPGSFVQIHTRSPTHGKTHTCTSHTDTRSRNTHTHKHRQKTTCNPTTDSVVCAPRLRPLLVTPAPLCAHVLVYWYAIAGCEICDPYSDSSACCALAPAEP